MKLFIAVTLIFIVLAFVGSKHLNKRLKEVESKINNIKYEEHNIRNNIEENRKSINKLAESLGKKVEREIKFNGSVFEVAKTTVTDLTENEKEIVRLEKRIEELKEEEEE